MPLRPSPLVAVVDDDPSMREACADLLGALGYRAVVFSSGDEFALAGRAFQPDCIILDMHMPGLCGLDLQRLLNVQGARIPCIFLTSEQSEDVRRRAFEGGARAFLGKPPECGELERCLSEVMGVEIG